ncbi:MAG: MerR family transcriptional regulator [Chlamydiales bacterium]|nr:MerR family transcriptional regulator [Chlamydiales bacterium]
MSYTVKELAEYSGVSVRTLHWYDEIGLLKPACVGANGYRYYEEEELLLLQQILLYRKLEGVVKRWSILKALLWKISSLSSFKSPLGALCIGRLELSSQ